MSFRGPAIRTGIFRCSRNILLGGRCVLQFRLEAYNALNHTQWSSINATATFDPPGRQVNANFGKVTDTRPPRRMQLGIRLNL
jgi:hypothetical protein